MKINLDTKLVNVSTGDLIQWDEKKGESATLKKILIEALSAPMKDPSPVDLVKNYDLAKKIVKAKEPVDLTSEQITLLKVLVATRFPVPFIAGAVFEALEGESDASS